MTCSFLGIVSAVLDILKAVDAYLNGEPGVIVAWMGASATISGILAFYAWWSFGISLVLALITIALAILTMQELTLPQRLWVHRSVFGRPNHNYYNSVPFGGNKPRSLPNDPAAADEWKDYQHRALNEEAQALGMLVTGITLQVEVIREVTGNIGMAPDLHPKKTFSTISTTVAIPEKIDVDFVIEIQKPKNVAIFSAKLVSKRFIFRKQNKTFGQIDEKEYTPKDYSINSEGNLITKIEHKTNILQEIIIVFSAFENGQSYKSIASDKIKTRG